MGRHRVRIATRRRHRRQLTLRQLPRHAFTLHIRVRVRTAGHLRRVIVVHRYGACASGLKLRQAAFKNRIEERAGRLRCKKIQWGRKNG